MKRLFVLVLAAVAAAASAAEFPFELAAHRKPSVQTNGNCLVKGGRILTVTKGVVEEGDILVEKGKIVKIGKDLSAPAGYKVIDAKGKVVMPGIVDAHIHRGSDGTNEGSDSITGEVRIQDVLNPNAKNVWQALAGGETAGLILHGSANIIGGQSQVVKLKYGTTPKDMMVPDAPRMIKFALGENVTRSGQATSTRFPKTRMGVQAAYRRAFTEAKNYMAAWDAYEKKKATDPKAVPPRKDLRLDVLADIMRKKVWVHCHSYRADEMLMMVRLSQEFGFKIGALTHALEAYKIAPELHEAGVGVSMFVDNWSFKVEGYDAIPYNAAICSAAGVLVSINTDGTGGSPAIAIDAAKTMRFGGLSEEQALATITINPAKQLGIDHRTGSLEVGKDADITIWDGHPLSVYSKCRMSMIEGEVYFERRDAFGVDSKSFTKNVLDKNERRGALPLPKPSKGYVIENATIHPVAAPVMQGSVLVVDGKIAAVGKTVNVPSGVTKIDGRGLHVYPGFIDTGTSMGLSEISPIGQMNDNAELGQFQPDLIAQTAVQIQSEHFPVARANGITSAVSRPTGGVVCGQASLLNMNGWTAEMMSLDTRAALTVNFPGGTFFFGDDQCSCEDMDHGAVGHEYDTEEYMGGAPQGGGGGGGGGLGNTQAMTQYFDKALKYMADRKANPSMPIDASLEAMIPYLEGKHPVILRVRNAQSIRNAVAFAKKYNLKPILAGAQDAWKEAALLKSENIPVLVTPAGLSTLGANQPINDYDPFDTTYALPGLLEKAGIKFAFQSEQNASANNLPIRAAQSVAYGLSQERLLRALTQDAADILGVGDKVGSIEPGKIANLVISDGDPFELTSNICFVFIDGQPVKLENRHTRLRDQYTQRLDPFQQELFRKRNGR